MMSSRNILNLVLIAIVFTLFAVITYEPGSESKQVQALLQPAQLQGIKRIQRWHNNELTLAAQKNEDGWGITAPFEADASEFQIASLLAITQQKTMASIDPAQHDLKKFGLDRPAYRLKLGEFVFSFGATDPLHFRRYVLHMNRIHLIDDNSFRFLVQDAPMFVNKRIIPASKTIVRITTAHYSLSRQDNQTSWTLDPDDNRMSADEKNQLADAWRNAQATGISLARPSDNDSNQTVSIDFSDKTRLRFRLLRQPGQNALVNEKSGLKFEFSTDAMDQMLPKLST